MAPVPEYMRIRAYLINYINNPARSSSLIPPENELCRLFQVTRPTVRYAIKGLVNDNFLIPRRGMGTYINVEKQSQGADRLPTVGVIRGDGRNISCPIAPEIGRTLVMNGIDFQLIYLTNSDDPQRLLEFVKNGIDALIWEDTVNHRDLMTAVRDAGLPQLVVGLDRAEDFDSIYYPRPSRPALCEYVYHCGHRRMLFVHSGENADVHLRPGSWLHCFCAKMSELSGEKIDAGDCFSSVESLAERLKKWKEGTEAFTLVYSVAKFVPEISRILAEADVAVPRDLSFIAYGEGEGAYFGLNSCCHVDIFNPLKEAFFAWKMQRLVRKDLKGIFSRELKTVISPGETLKISHHKG